jgi:PKD repeat protein
LIRAKTFFGWSTISNTTNTTIRYSYVTKEAKGSVINFNYDTANVLQSINWSMTPPTAPVADFSFVNASNGLVNFTDLSDGYPTSWAWTFGDGGTSTSQNPNHTYTANGTYTACLIASNAGGSSTQVCKQVVVSNVPVAPVADFSWANPSGGLANFY